MPPTAALSCSCRPATTSSAAPSPSPPAFSRSSCCRRARSAASRRRGCRCSALPAGARPFVSLASFAALAGPHRGGLVRQPRPAVQPAAADRLDAAVGRAHPRRRACSEISGRGSIRGTGPAWLARRLGLCHADAAAAAICRLLAGLHSVCRLRMVRADRSGARRSVAPCGDRACLRRGQSRCDASSSAIATGPGAASSCRCSSA